MAGKKIPSSYSGWSKPTFTNIVKTNKDFRSYFHSAMLYAHYELSSNELKREVMVYLKKIDTKHPLLTRMEKLDEGRFVTIDKYMYILNHAGEIPDDVMPKLLSALEQVIDEEEVKIAAREKEAENIERKNQTDPNFDRSSKPTVSIQDRIKEKTREVAGEVEGWIDDYTTDKKLPVKTVEDFINLFKVNELKAPHTRFMQDIFEGRVDEIARAVEGKDKELVEAYANYSKTELKKCNEFNQNLLKACNMMQEVAKIERAPRKKKPVSQEKVVAKLKYKKDDNSLGIVSLNPVHIIGSKEVWLYNTKTRKLAQYKAADECGLLVKGAGLQNYTTDSVEKTIRKPVETLSDFKKASKVKLRTFMKDLSTIDIPCNGKLNEHHIILRIDK